MNGRPRVKDGNKKAKLASHGRPAASAAAARGSAVYNARILNLCMLTPTFPRLRVFFFVIFLLPFAVPVNAQNWEHAEEQLAQKILSANGTKTIALEVINRSSLSPETTDDIRRGLLTQLASLGVHFVAADRASTVVRVSLSEDLQNYIWVAETRQAANATSILIISLPRSAAPAYEAATAAMVLRKTSLWSQPDRILDVVAVEDNPTRMLVLDSNGVKLYRLQETRWQLEHSIAIPHTHPWPRDLRGRLRPGRDRSFEVFLPGIHCRGTTIASSTTCNDSDDRWP